jgi:hypothetical protein
MCLLVLVGLIACQGRSAQISAPDAASAAPIASAPSSAPALPELQISITAEVPDAGLVPIPFSGGEQPEIPPVRTLVVETNLPLQNYRVRVFDEADRAMVSDDEAEHADGGLRYRIQFPELLPTGHRYAMVLDPQTGAQLLDSHGRSHDDVRLEFRIAGEKAKPRPPPQRKRSRRR